MSLRQMVESAWLEFRVTKQCSMLVDAWLAIESVEVPGWFIAAELGFAIEDGPSIIESYARRRGRARARRVS